MIGILIDKKIAHKLLVFKAGILHRDISINNMMLLKGNKMCRKGFLIDFDWAVLYIIRKKKGRKSTTTDKENIAPANKSTGRVTRSQKVDKVAAEPKGEDIRGHRTVKCSYKL